jgi:hypothetical protein
VNLNIHFDLAELVIYMEKADAVTAGVVWHLIGNLAQGAALHLNAALLRKAELKKKRSKWRSPARDAERVRRNTSRCRQRMRLNAARQAAGCRVCPR